MARRLAPSRSEPQVVGQGDRGLGEGAAVAGGVVAEGGVAFEAQGAVPEPGGLEVELQVDRLRALGRAGVLLLPGDPGRGGRELPAGDAQGAAQAELETRFRLSPGVGRAVVQLGAAQPQGRGAALVVPGQAQGQAAAPLVEVFLARQLGVVGLLLLERQAEVPGQEAVQAGEIDVEAGGPGPPAVGVLAGLALDVVGRDAVRQVQPEPPPVERHREPPPRPVRVQVDALGPVAGAGQREAGSAGQGQAVAAPEVGGQAVAGGVAAGLLRRVEGEAEVRGGPQAFAEEAEAVAGADVAGGLRVGGVLGHEGGLHRPARPGVLGAEVGGQGGQGRPLRGLRHVDCQAVAQDRGVERQGAGAVEGRHQRVVGAQLDPAGLLPRRGGAPRAGGAGHRRAQGVRLPRKVAEQLAVRGAGRSRHHQQPRRGEAQAGGGAPTRGRAPTN